MTDTTNLIAINVGNTRTHLGLFMEGDLAKTRHFANSKLKQPMQLVQSWWEKLTDLPSSAIVIASVNDDVSKRLASAVKDQLSVEVYRAGEDMPVPIGRQLDPETITGIDRLLNAAAGYDLIKQACVIVDAGTAITVDFVDGEGTFHGGAIAPGGQMQLDAMHQFTDALPEVEFAAPQSEAFGRSTSQAMLHGVYHGIRGMVWRLIENYAMDYEAYPTVIATGGDAQLLFSKDKLFDQIVPDLTLQGIRLTAKLALQGSAD